MSIHPTDPLVDHLSLPMLAAMLDSVSDQIAILDEQGTIVYANQSWRAFRRGRGSPWEDGTGFNYLQICRDGREMAADIAGEVVHGISDVLAGRSQYFEITYPLRGNARETWFWMRAWPLAGEQTKMVVVNQVNISAQRSFPISLTTMPRYKNTPPSPASTPSATPRIATPPNNTSPEMIGNPAGSTKTSGKGPRKDALVFEKNLAETALNTLDYLFIVLSLDGQLLHWNRPFSLVTGYSDEEIAGMTPENFFTDGQIGRLHQALTQIRETGKIHLELFLKTRAGQVIPFEFSAVLIDSPGAFVQCICALGRNISRRLEAKAERERLFSVSRDLMCVTGFDGYFKELNPAWEKTLGWTLPELKARPLAHFVHPEDHQILQKVMDALFQGENVSEFEIRFRCKDESYRWLTWNATPYLQRKQIYAVARDDTRHKNSEAALKESEEKYRNLFENSKDVVYISLPEDKFLDVNPAGVTLFGYASKAELLDICLSRDLYVDPRDRLAMLNEFEKNGLVKDYEVRLKRKDGQEILVQNTATAMYDREGRIYAFCGIMRDITHYKKMQKQLVQTQKMEAIGTLAGGIAHDFNNILAALLGYSELLRLDLAEGTRGRSNLEQIITATLRARELVKQILTFSHQVEQEFGEVQLSNIVKEVSKLLRASLPASIEIQLDIRDKTGIVIADVTQMHQLLMNLCTNAFHAMRKSGGVLSVILERTCITEAQPQIAGLAPGEYVKLSVRDTGCGMDSTTLKHIFDPFFTTKPVGEGTGLGLAVVHGILKSHGGGINVISEVGQGSTFEVFLPRTEKRRAATDAQNRELPQGTAHILFIDDETAIVESGKQLLARLGYTITPSIDPLQGFELFKQQPEKYDLVITDYHMPKLNGLILSQKLQKIRKDIPIIIMTGSSGSLTIEQCQETQIKEILQKPLVTYDFANAIHRVLSISAGEEKYFEENSHR